MTILEVSVTFYILHPLQNIYIYIYIPTHDVNLLLVYNYILKQGGPRPTQPTQSNETTGICIQDMMVKESLFHGKWVYIVHIKFFFINDNGHPLKAQNKLFKLN